MKLALFFFSIFITVGVNAFEINRGGVYCTQCPAESSKCAPRPDCRPSDNLQDSSVINKGGVYCTQCPGETSKCTPRPDCRPSGNLQDTSQLDAYLSSMSLNGGVYCKQCPGENSKCAPRPDCCPASSDDNCGDAQVGSACGSNQETTGTCRVSQEKYSCFCSSNFLN